MGWVSYIKEEQEAQKPEYEEEGEEGIFWGWSTPYRPM